MLVSLVYLVYLVCLVCLVWFGLFGGLVNRCVNEVQAAVLSD